MSLRLVLCLVALGLNRFVDEQTTLDVFHVHNPNVSPRCVTMRKSHFSHPAEKQKMSWWHKKSWAGISLQVGFKYEHGQILDGASTELWAYTKIWAQKKRKKVLSVDLIKQQVVLNFNGWF